MAAPAITKGSDHFFTTTYEGNGGGQKVGNFVPFTDNGTIDNSVIYNRSDNPKLTRTPSSNGNRRTFTISVWYKPTDLGTRRILCSADTSGSDYGLFELNENNKLFWTHSSVGDIISTRTFEDTSKFYHFMLAVDTTQSTASDRVKLYADGNLITSLDSSTYPSQDFQTNFNSTSYPIAAGTYNSLTGYATGGYIAEFNFVDGTALGPSTFGVTDTSTGRWVPKTLSGITYGTNGFRLEFKTAGTLGDDTSGNTNDFTATNLASTDQTTDSPTQNHATLSPHSLYKSSNYTLSEGNLKATSTSVSGTHSGQGGMRIPSGGKYYWEVEIDSGKDGMGVGIIPTDTPTTSANPGTATIYLSSGSMRTDGSNALSYGSGVSNGDIIGFALDLSDPQNGKLWVSVNGTYENSGNPVTGANPAPANALIGDFRVLYQDGSNGFTPVYIFNFGQKSFNTAAPTGYSALQQDNFPDEGVKTDFVWIKNRDAGDSHQLYDSSRGAPIKLSSDISNAQLTINDGLQKFLKGGFELEDNNSVNTSGESYVALNWVANNGVTATNNDGSGTSTVQVNSTSNFSIVQYNGTGSDQTLGHGLGVKPDTIWVKNIVENSATGSGVSWRVWQKDAVSLNSDDNTYLRFDSDDSRTAGGDSWGDTQPTSSVFTVGADVQTNASVSGGTAQYIAYCFANVDGYFKTDYYLGNGNANGPFVYTGFKPSLVIIKGWNIGNNWIVWDNKRSLFNPCDNVFYPDLSQAETTSGNDLDFLSNGFKCRGTNSNYNGSYTYIYWAFAEHPFIGSSSISPVTAR